MIIIEIWLSCLRSRLKNTSQGFLNPLFSHLLSGEDQTVTNLPNTVKSNHRVKNLFHSLGFIPKSTNLPYTVKSNQPVKNPFHYLGFIPKPEQKHSIVSTKDCCTKYGSLKE